MLWKEEQRVRVTEVNLRKADRFPCTVLCSFWSYLEQEEWRNGSEFFPEQDN